MTIEDLLDDARRHVKEANYVLTEDNFGAILTLFRLCAQNPRALETLQQKTKEFGKPEFFLNVKHDGKPVGTSASLLMQFHEKLNKQSELATWFVESDIPTENSGKTLLAARWLCHLIGLRHRCAHIFLDDPNFVDCTLVQVRSYSKTDSPGCLDIPVGGHAKGVEEIFTTAAKELEEELALSQSDVEDFDPKRIIVADYPYAEPPKRPDFHNIECRTVFVMRLRPPGLTRIRFRDKEVAAVMIMRLSQLVTLIERFPERAASGLLGSLSYYLAARNQAGEKEVQEGRDFSRRLEMALGSTKGKR